MTIQTSTQRQTRRLPFTVDGGVGSRANLALLVLRTDQTLEAEHRVLVQLPGVALYHARIYNDARITPETLRKMIDEIPVGCRLLPDAFPFHVIGYACTSGAMTIGSDRVAALVNAIKPEASVTDPVVAARAALRAADVTTMALLTPYSESITEQMAHFFEAMGFRVTAVGSFFETDDNTVARITPASIVEGARRLAALATFDALFVACTSLRVAGVVEEIEQEFGFFVSSSNHALGWHMLRLAGVGDSVDGRGRLFRLPMPTGAV
jgi:maleate isomerase